MKIGIMSMQRIYNYGSFMQAYCLKKIIKSIGYDVEFVDYKIENPIINDNSTKKINKIINNINILNYIKKKSYYVKFHMLYNEYLNQYLNIKIEKNYAYNRIDLLIIGSDEVFNCLQGYPVGYSKELFGKNYENTNVISYAGSFGNTNLEDLNRYNVANEIKELLLKFKDISVRDKNSFDIVKALINSKPNINLDPVLIADLDEELIDNVEISNYIVIYAYSGRLSKKELSYIKKFAKKHNKKIVSLGGYQSIADYNFIVNPFELYAYFKHADFVITDTFHGTIFSVKNHTKFGTIIRNGSNGNNNKLYDLLERIDKTDRIINTLDEIESLYDKEINYDYTDEIIKKEKEKTIKYLFENINNSFKK